MESRKMVLINLVENGLVDIAQKRKVKVGQTEKVSLTYVHYRV